MKSGEKNPLALSTYIQLIEAFGWDAILKANQIYREAYNAGLVKDKLANEQRIDLWFTTMCQATNKNLSDFFAVWQIPVSKEAKETVKTYRTGFLNFTQRLNQKLE